MKIVFEIVVEICYKSVAENSRNNNHKYCNNKKYEKLKQNKKIKNKSYRINIKNSQNYTIKRHLLFEANVEIQPQIPTIIINEPEITKRIDPAIKGEMPMNSSKVCEMGVFPKATAPITKTGIPHTCAKLKTSINIIKILINIFKAKRISLIIVQISK